VCFIF
jgi:WD40 repeat protein